MDSGMSTRKWVWPHRQQGTTIAVLADTQIQRRAWQTSLLAKVVPDLDALTAEYADVCVLAGDIVHWGTGADTAAFTAQETQAQQWVAGRKNAAAVPWVIAAGNHDLAGFTAPYASRTGDQWAQAWGLPSRNTIVQVGPLTIIGFTPAEWDFSRVSNGSQVYAYGPQRVTAEEIIWLEAAISGAPGDVWVVSHSPLNEHYAGNYEGTALSELVGRSPKLKGWISGHRHPNMTKDSAVAQVVTVGTRSLVCVNVPACGGVTYDIDETRDQWLSTWSATLVTVLPEGKVEIRFRDVLNRDWQHVVSERMVTLPYA